MEKPRVYACIDMKSFFASVECAERGLNPFETNLAVTDTSRGRGALCLAVTPRMKALGVKNRCRVYEIPAGIPYIAAKPRMRKYIGYAADIYGIYLDYMDRSDIYVYSVDESFLDMTDYLKIYKKTPREFAAFLIGEIADRLHIPAAAGIGTNLYLAKIALDITAKKSPERIGILDEETFRRTLGNHRPLTDFWGIAGGISRRLARYGIYTMDQIARCPEELLYREFGINAELLIDHASGREYCTMEDIKSYRTKSRSVSNSQILFGDYTAEKAELIVTEMVRSGCLEMMRRGLIARSVAVYAGYSRGVRPPTGGSVRMRAASSLPRMILPYARELYRRTADFSAPVRSVSVSFGNVCDEGCEGYDLFTDWESVEKEKSLSKTVLELQDRFGKNAVVTAADLQEGATLRQRNLQIGGHSAQ